MLLSIASKSLSNSSLPRILTGARPTGPLHIGHYFGYLKTCLDLELESQMFLMIADVQALTDNWDETNKVSTAVNDVALDILAMLAKPEETVLFIQSQIPQIAELTVFFSNLVTVNRLQRNPTVKTEIAQKQDKFGQNGESITYGFLGYPVSQTADVAVIRADCVPVGIDQVPILEQAKEILERFDRTYNSQIFPNPKPKLSATPKILGLDGNVKMSKSIGNTVFLKATEEETINKIKSAKTDSLTEIGYEPETRPEISNLVQLFSFVTNSTIEEVLIDLKGIRYGDFKIQLAQEINNYFREFRQRRAELANNPQKVKQLLEQGKNKTLIEAEITLKLVRQAMGIDY
jgi:tryptophanyl-tRNA synthetase